MPKVKRRARRKHGSERGTTTKDNKMCKGKTNILKSHLTFLITERRTERGDK